MWTPLESYGYVDQTVDGLRETEGFVEFERIWSGDVQRGKAAYAAREEETGSCTAGENLIGKQNSNNHDALIGALYPMPSKRRGEDYEDCIVEHER
jgi:hypothetical protein